MTESSYYCYGFELIPFPDYELLGGGLLVGYDSKLSYIIPAA